MDRNLLVERNRRMAEAFHKTSFKEKIRRAILYDVGHIPFSPQPVTAESSQRVLLIRPDHLGDVLLTTPSIQALRRALPQSEIHALVGSWSANVLAPFDEIDHVLTLPFPAFDRNPKLNWRSPYQLAWRSAQKLRKIGYGQAVILRPDHWWGALLAWMAGIPVRVGYDHPDLTRFITHVVPRQEKQHAVEQNIRLIQRLLDVPTTPINPQDYPLNYPVSSEERSWIHGYLEEWDLPQPRRMIAIHAGSGSIYKNWDNSRWASVADTLSEQLDATIILTGSTQEIPLAKAIASEMKQIPIIAAGDTNIGTLAALFEQCLIVLGTDSGPLHLASAVKTPTVALFGPADPIEFGTWGPKERHIILASTIGCRPCRILNWAGDDLENHPCMRDIQLGQVLTAARTVARASLE